MWLCWLFYFYLKKLTDKSTGNPGSVIVAQYGSSKITVFVLACVAGVWKGRESGCEGNARAREEGGRETPARKPLFLPSRLLIMYAKITQPWMTSCQISLAAMGLFKSYFAYCFSFVFLKQEIWSEGTIKTKYKCGRLLKEERCNHAWLVI